MSAEEIVDEREREDREEERDERELRERERERESLTAAQHVQACEGLPGDRSDTIALQEPGGTENKCFQESLSFNAVNLRRVFPSMQ